MACKPHRWPATKTEVEALISPALAASQTLRDAATALGVTEAALRGVVRFHQIPFASLLGRPAISPGVAVSGVGTSAQVPTEANAPAPLDWTGARPVSTGVGLERRVLLGDMHIPFHDLTACAAALAVIRALQPHRVIQMGDLWNMGAVDHHPRPFGGKESHSRAMLMGRAFLEAVRKAAPGAELVVLLGNHDTYADEYEDANPQHVGVFVPTWLTQIATVIPRRKQPWVCGPVAYLHGYGGGEHAAKKYALEIAPSAGVRHVKAGHHHSVQRFHAKNGCEGWIVGWLGDASAPTFDYAKMRGHWERALVVEDVIGERVTTTPVRLDGGVALFGGRLISRAA